MKKNRNFLARLLQVMILLSMCCVFTACPDSKGDEDDMSNSSESGKNSGNDKSGTSHSGIADGHEWVDLGLPSGTLWATCNVGATNPEDYGDYYAWGETEVKNEYKWNTYKYGSNWDKVVHIGSNIAGTQYDAATANWGSHWCMPTTVQCKELIDNTTSTWTFQNGIRGRMFTSDNGENIFFPSAGLILLDGFHGVGSFTDYWLSTLSGSNPHEAYVFNCDATVPNCNGDQLRYAGHPIRPVIMSTH